MTPRLTPPDWWRDYVHPHRHALAKDLRAAARNLAYGVAGQVRTALPGDGEPVLLLPGLLEYPGYCRSLATALRAHGFAVHFVRALGMMTAPVDQLAEAATAYLDEHDLTGVTIVAHSKGGLVGKRLMLADPERYLGMVAIATPWQGSAWGDVLRWRVMTSLGTESPHVARLSAETAVDHRITAVAVAHDEIVPGGGSLPGADNVLVDGYGHYGSVDEPEVIDLVLKRALQWREEREKEQS